MTRSIFFFNQSKLIIENRNQTLIGEKRTLALHSGGLLACLAKSPAWEKVLPHFSQPKGFRPMCDRMWLFRVVAPANARKQKPHLNGFSLECEITCARSWEELEKETLHCPQLKGLLGWLGHTCICKASRCAKVLWHCWHRHEASSPTGLFAIGTWLLPPSLTSLSASLKGDDCGSVWLLSVDDILGKKAVLFCRGSCNVGCSCSWGNCSCCWCGGGEGLCSTAIGLCIDLLLCVWCSSCCCCINSCCCCSGESLSSNRGGAACIGPVANKKKNKT